LVWHVCSVFDFSLRPFKFTSVAAIWVLGWWVWIPPPVLVLRKVLQ
jgi:hypothetical protein